MINDDGHQPVALHLLALTVSRMVFFPPTQLLPCLVSWLHSLSVGKHVIASKFYLKHILCLLSLMLGVTTCMTIMTSGTFVKAWNYAAHTARVKRLPVNR